jgi:vacuolar-type H+-ATPase subunit B/Vma2
VLNSLDGSWAVRLSGFAVRIACQNQLYAEAGNVAEWRELHLSTETDLLAQLERAIHDFLGHFEEGLVT